MAYVFDKNFLRNYKEIGGEYFISNEFWSEYYVPLRQAQYDRRHMYSLLRMTTRGVENRILDKYSKTADGFLAWIEFIERYSCNGSKEVKVETLELEISKPCTATYPGGLERYIDDFQINMSQLDVLRTDVELSDASKKRMLLRNLREVPGIAHLLQSCKDNPDRSYEETATYLQVNTIHIHNKQKSQSTMLNVVTDEVEADSSELDL